MKILLVNQAFYPDVVATAQHLTDIACDLSEAGHEVTVLAGRRGYAEPHPVYPRIETYKEIKIIRVWPFTLGRKSRILRVIDALCVNLAFAFQLLWLPRFEKVICLTTPPLVAWIAVLFARSRNSEFIYWMMDVNPDEAIEAGWIRKGGIRAGILESALKFVLKKSHKIIVLDVFMKKRIMGKGAEESKVFVNPPWAHTDDISLIEHEDNPFRKQHGLNGKFVVMYSGNHSVCHPLGTLLEAAQILKEDKDICFLFIGGGERVKDVLDFKARHQLDNIMYLPYVPRDQLKFSLSAADVHTVVMGDPFVGIVHPSKIYGILSVGRPVLYVGPAESAISDVLEPEGIGMQAEHGSAEAVSRAILQFKEAGHEELVKIRSACQAAVNKKYSRKVVSQKLMEYVLNSVSKDA